MIDVSCDDFTVRVGVDPTKVASDSLIPVVAVTTAECVFDRRKLFKLYLFGVTFTPRTLRSDTCHIGLRLRSNFLKHERLSRLRIFSRAFYQRCCRPVVCFLELISEFQVFARKVCSIIFLNVFLWYVMKYGSSTKTFLQCCFFANVKFILSNPSRVIQWSNRLGYLVQAKMVLPSPEELVFDKDVRPRTII